jgi:hypothetical protein
MVDSAFPQASLGVLFSRFVGSHLEVMPGYVVFDMFTKGQDMRRYTFMNQ